MALTITPPADKLPAYNPILIDAVSDVRDDFTVEGVVPITSVTAATGGFAQLGFDNVSSVILLQGDYLLITSAPGAEYLLGVSLITSVIDSDTVIINKPFFTNVSSDGASYKYISNYSALLKFYVYVTTAPSTALLVATKTLRPRFESGVCVFNIDLAGLIQSYNFAGIGASDVLGSDIYAGAGAVQTDNKSFVKYGYELFEAFDNPVGGQPVYQQEVTA